MTGTAQPLKLETQNPKLETVDSQLRSSALTAQYPLKGFRFGVRCSMFDVRCWMFAFLGALWGIA